MSLSSKPIGSISALSLSSKPIGSISAPPLVSVPNTYSTWHIVGAQNTMLLKNQSVQSLSHVWLFATPWTEVHQASLSITNSWSLLRLVSIESVRPSNKYYSVTKNWVTEASLQWSSIKCEWKSLSRVWLFVTPQTVACQASLSMEFSRQEYWSG